MAPTYVPRAIIPRIVSYRSEQGILAKNEVNCAPGSMDSLREYISVSYPGAHLPILASLYTRSSLHPA